MDDITDELEDLSDDELLARLVQRGTERDTAIHLVRSRLDSADVRLELDRLLR